MKTAATELFGIDIPIFAFSHCRDVVAAVSKAGGLGVLGAVTHTEEQLAIDLEWIEAELGGRPYGVDVIVPAWTVGSDAIATIADVEAMIPQSHRDFLREIMEKYEVPPLPDGEEGGRFGLRSEQAAPFSPEQVGAQLDVALSYDATLYVNALGPPPGFMIDKVKKANRLIGALAGKVQHAVRHVNAGVDLIIAQGAEAGGHTGEIGTMVLVPEVVDAVNVPVLGAGGIGRGRQMAAAMALGASGVWCGSVWLTTLEAETHPVVKEKFLAATAEDTIRSRSLTGKPARQLKSAWTEEWEDPNTPAPLPMPLQPILIDEAAARIDRAAHHAGSGAERLINYFVGQVVGSMNESKPTSQVIFEMVDEFVDAVTELGIQLES
jgi:NAD(P)H-dependent flavin oxidoreductase YrpB (nitropropane dioxygenase family)